jgi:hypothetical protein
MSSYVHLTDDSDNLTDDSDKPRRSGMEFLKIPKIGPGKAVPRKKNPFGDADNYSRGGILGGKTFVR